MDVKHDDVTGLLGMVNKSENGAYINEYNYDGCGWLSKSNGKWERDTEPEGSQTQDAGKVTAISNVLCKRYGHCPCAVFIRKPGHAFFERYHIPLLYVPSGCGSAIEKMALSALFVGRAACEP